MLVDPSKPILLTLLKNIPEFIQQANHNYLAFYDNVKYIPYWLSDELCKTVTGIGHTKRELYSDDNDVIYEHRRCISINGINVALTEPDALDRSILIELPDIDEIARKEKEELLLEFESVRPKLLAYIFDIVVKALQIRPILRLSRLPRMADFAKWGEAISRAIGYDDFAFIEAFANNRNQQNIVAVEENIAGSVFVQFYNDYEINNSLNSMFVGSPEMLYNAITDLAEANEININFKQFPKAPNILVKKLKAIKSNLMGGYNIVVDIKRDSSNNSIITIYRKKTTTNLLLNHHYSTKVRQNHLSYCYILKCKTTHNNEVTSVTSEPPTSTQSSTYLATGGTESTEVTSLSCGVTDSTKNNKEAKSENLSTENSVPSAASNNNEGFKN